MQTFLPDPDFQTTATILDNKRLGKQRVETLQIVNSIVGLSKGWRNHPATVMWELNVISLIDYGIVICNEYSRRGFQDTVKGKLNQIRKSLITATSGSPSWLGNSRFHDSHKSNLLRKDFQYYSQFQWDVPTDLPYYWPGNSIWFHIS